MATFASAYSGTPESRFERFTGTAGATAAVPVGAHNSAFWLPGLDFTPVSFVGGDTDGSGSLFQYPATLISARHCITANHIGHAQRYVWMRPDGSFAAANVLDSRDLDGDLRVNYLASAITGITPMRTLPAGWEGKLPMLTGDDVGAPSPLLPVCFVGGRTKSLGTASVVQVHGVSSVKSTTYRNELVGTHPASVGRLICAVEIPITPGLTTDVIPSSGEYLGSRFGHVSWLIRGGNSSGLKALALPGGLAALSAETGGGGGSSIPARRGEINAAMDSLAGAASGTWQMGTVDLSSYTTF